MIIFLLLLILAVLFLGTGGVAALFLFLGFTMALLVTWACFGPVLAFILGAAGFFLWIK